MMLGLIEYVYDNPELVYFSRLAFLIMTPTLCIFQFTNMFRYFFYGNECVVATLSLEILICCFSIFSGYFFTFYLEWKYVGAMVAGFLTMVFGFVFYVLYYIFGQGFVSYWKYNSMSS